MQGGAVYESAVFGCVPPLRVAETVGVLLLCAFLIVGC